jgi:hypothetical protein
MARDDPASNVPGKRLKQLSAFSHPHVDVQPAEALPSATFSSSKNVANDANFVSHTFISIDGPR